MALEPASRVSDDTGSRGSCHLIFQLPEIVEQIMQHVAPQRYQHHGPGSSSSSSSYSSRAHSKGIKELAACLYVNWLWHDCASRLTWRHISFDDTKQDYDQLLKFASIVGQAPASPFMSTSSSLATMAMSIPPTPSPSISSSTESSDDASSVTITEAPALDLVPTYYCPRIRSLMLRKIKEKNINEPLQVIGQHAASLTILDVYICDYVTNAALYPFLTHGHLTYLSLAGCQRVTDEAIIRLAHSCPQLQHLDLRACGLVSDQSITQVAMHCPLLRHLNVGRVRDRHHITDASIELIARQTQVSVLGLAGCDVSDISLVTLATHRRSGIERISINNCYRATNKTIQAYVTHCPRLSVFEMKECHHIHDWEAVAELVHRKVLLTLCDQQNRACTDWAKRHGRVLDVKAPVK
ncbi:hypothetical protein BC940DRAFT_239312 [Gongronella butleri]|nr:hypothetical protein BC940DRAFT_239312 [Gongronella butleri]